MHNRLTEVKLITCILPKGRAYPLQKNLIEQRGINSVNFHGARGIGRFSTITERGIGEQQEKEILEVTVPSDGADELFEYIYFTGEMNEPHGGIIFMTTLHVATTMEMPDLPKEED